MTFFKSLSADLAIRDCLITTLALLLAVIASALTFNSDYLILILPYLAYSYILLFTTASLIQLFGLMRSMPKEKSALAYWPKLIRRQLTDIEFYRHYLAPSALCITLLPLFTNMKLLIPILNPFYADALLMHADKWLHGGHLPHEYLTPYITPDMLYWLDQVYPTLIPFCILYFIFMGTRHSKPEARYAFMVGFNLCWIVLGIGLAVIFSSMGPCYYSTAMPGDATYTGLMKWVLDMQAQSGSTFKSPLIQNYLLDLYQSGSAGIGGGISAMPSLHAAIPTLMIWSGFRIHPLLGIGAVIYLLLVMASTISLGWHYGVDLYFSIIAASVFWLLLERRARKAMAQGRLIPQ